MASPIKRLRDSVLHTQASDALTDLSLLQLGAQIRAGTLSPVALVDAHIDRCRAINPAINALIADRFEEARAEARTAESRLAAMTPAERGALSPLFGVPCSIKEFLGVVGMPQTGGMLHRRDQRANADGIVVSRLRRAGAIILGVTNVPEGGLWLETHNLIHGRTRNPWNLGRTAGGSSGGEGALIAAGGAVFGLGSDIGGSIRIPAGFCGTIGHKPSGGLIPNTGHFPPGDGKHPYLCIGPLTRRVEDVMPILRAIAGPDEGDIVCKPMPLQDPASIDLRQVKVIPLPASGSVRIAEVMRAAVEESATALQERGARIQSLDLPELRHVFTMWMMALSTANPHTYSQLLSNGQGVPLGRELLKLALGRAGYSLPSLVTVLSEAVMRRLPIDARKQLDRLAQLRELLDAQLGENGVLLHPPYSRPAPRHLTPLLTPFDCACTALFNILGYPVTVVPVGFDKDGLPVAVQVAARAGNDHLTLAVAQALERTFGGWVRAEPEPPSRRSRSAQLVDLVLR